MGELEAVRLWGRYYMNTLFESFPSLLAPDDPTESLMRFKVMGRTFFDFDAVTIESLVGHQAQIRSEFGMSPRAEEASAHQLVGFFERLMDAAGADDMEWEFLSRRWAGDDATIVQIEWHKANPSLSYSRER